MKILLQTRFFETRPEYAGEARSKIGSFIYRASAVDAIARVDIAVNIDADRACILDFLNEEPLLGVKVYPVTPWGRFVPALNATLEMSRGGGFTHLLVVSAEVVVTAEMVWALAKHVSEDTLVVGARVEGHEFHPGKPLLNGLTSPWNTCALWDLAKLYRLGFPLTGEALFDPTGAKAGVEEAATIAVYNMLYADCRAKLVEVPGFVWDTSGFSAERAEAHRKKMASKKQRANVQQLETNLFHNIQVSHIQSKVL